MIKIKTIIDEKNHQSYPIRQGHFRRALKKKGIVFVDRDPDILLIHQIKFNDKYLKTNTPIIILERIDSACVTKRKLIKEDQVIGVIKNTIFRDPELNNASVQYGRYHAKRVVDTCRLQKIDKSLQFYDQKIKLTDKDIQKLYPGWTFGMYPQMKRFLDLNIDYRKPRATDISFYGTSNYGPKTVAINFHRQQAINAIKKLKRCNGVSGSGRPLAKQKYDNLLLDSKISLSPWGLGEACYRDFEAILCGSVLIKPDSSFVTGAQDIYQDKYYIPCKVDFSDLQEKVDWVKKNWKDLIPMRKRARHYIISWWDNKKFTEHIYKIITSCSKRI